MAPHFLRRPLFHFPVNRSIHRSRFKYLSIPKKNTSQVHPNPLYPACLSRLNVYHSIFRNFPPRWVTYLNPRSYILFSLPSSCPRPIFHLPVAHTWRNLLLLTSHRSSVLCKSNEFVMRFSHCCYCCCCLGNRKSDSPSRRTHKHGRKWLSTLFSQFGIKIKRSSL